MDDSTVTRIPLPSSPLLPHRSYLGWQTVITLFHLLATSMTVYRLLHRRRIGRLWWDDHILLVGLIADFAYWPVYWARSPSVENPSAGFLRTQRILRSYWVSLFPYFFILGCTRVSMALSLVRLFPPKHPARYRSFILVWFLVFTNIGATLSPVITCKPTSALLVISELQHCIRINEIPLKNIVGLISDVVSDLSLSITPLASFWHVKLPARERRLILVFFCGSSLTLLSAVLYIAIVNSQSVAKLLEEDILFINLGMGAIEVSVSLVASNLVVISTCFYQAFLRFRNRERPALESTVETARVPPSRECTCAIPTDVSRLTLTEISNSYDRSQSSRGILGIGIESERQHDSPAMSQNSQGSLYLSQDSQSTSGSKSYLSRSMDAPSGSLSSFSPHESYDSSNNTTSNNS